ncbi:MAG: hypothetical protein Hyperionvirus37_8 [Hyperionvirus sp.]|uniref:Minor capsid protein P8 central region domain-containing protein n=1 Tax=Hyperionvirus sp. TaxID=2487770 RepID=A0A3G5AC04_9VIRU|nr:MAG: hypothetical protein Hyperionvirus37_8 [Hyperionvirus sp.]
MNFANFNSRYRSPDRDRQTASMMTKGIISGVDDENDNIDPVTLMFFSEENMKRLQKMIRNEVNRRTKGKYVLKVDQEENDLLVVMRAVLLDMNGSDFQPNKVKHQVKKLNNKTVRYVVPDMIESIKSHYGYLKEISEPREMPIMQPMNVNNKGRRTLPSITTIWGGDK